MISIIHPSRNRVSKSVATANSWIENSINKDFEWITSIDSDDPQLLDYINSQPFYHNFRVVYYNNKSSVEAINKGAALCNGDIIMVVSDDTDCFYGWDVALLNEVKGKTDWILKTRDGIQDWIITMPVMDRQYYNRTKRIYYHGYKHLFCDTDLTCEADITGRKLTSRLYFPHNHYSIGKSTLDSVYSKNDKTNEQGEKLFLERYARNFDLPQGYKIQDAGLINWLKKRHVA